MKKLLMYNHLGEKVFEADVFVEGKDFWWDIEQPVAIWLKSLCIVDQESDFEAAEKILEEQQQLATIIEGEVAEGELKTVNNQSDRDEGSSPAE